MPLNSCACVTLSSLMVSVVTVVPELIKDNPGFGDCLFYAMYHALCALYDVKSFMPALHKPRPFYFHSDNDHKKAIQMLRNCVTFTYWTMQAWSLLIPDQIPCLDVETILEEVLMPGQYTGTDTVFAAISVLIGHPVAVRRYNAVTNAPEWDIFFVHAQPTCAWDRPNEQFYIRFAHTDELNEPEIEVSAFAEALTELNSFDRMVSGPELNFYQLKYSEHGYLTSAPVKPPIVLLHINSVTKLTDAHCNHYAVPEPDVARALSAELHLKLAEKFKMNAFHAAAMQYWYEINDAKTNLTNDEHNRSINVA